MHYKLSKSSTALRVLALILACLFCAAAAMAQEKATGIAPSAQPQTTVANPAVGETGLVQANPTFPKPETSTITATPLTQSHGSTGNGSSDYKKTLNDLQALYEHEVQRLEQQNAQTKGLSRDGLIARVELEKSDKDL